jgi:hypothetical protein
MRVQMRSRAIRTVLLASALVASVVAASARAAPGIVIGVDDDTLKWTEDAGSVVAVQRDLGISSDRVTLLWQPGQTNADTDQRTYLRRAQNAARMGQRVVLAIYGPAADAPTTQPAQDQFCMFTVDALSRARNIRDVVIWNEVNSALFWKPQLGAAVAYEALLADCYDRLHAFSRTVNVISSTSPHESPGPFIAGLGAAYRASGRTSPIFDTFGHDAYPEVSSESPLAGHPDAASLDEGDYVRLLAGITAAFGGTGQPVPGSGNAPSGGFLQTRALMNTKTGVINGTNAGGPVTIWYLEDGFETVTPGAARVSYTGRETNRQLLQPIAVKTTGTFVLPNQAGQLRDAVELAYCQPAVGAWFNFELVDEQGLGGWQSGLVYADHTAKPSYLLFKAELALVAARQVDCSRFGPGVSGQSPTLPATSAASSP